LLLVHAAYERSPSPPLLLLYTQVAANNNNKQYMSAARNDNNDGDDGDHFNNNDSISISNSSSLTLMIEPECARVLDIYFEVFPVQQFILDFLWCTHKFALWFARL